MSNVAVSLHRVCARTSKMFVRCVYIYVRAVKAVGGYTLSLLALVYLDVDSYAKHNCQSKHFFFSHHVGKALGE